LGYYKVVNATPFLIVGTYRTGSSAFAEQLGRHPQVACGWESVDSVWLSQRARRTASILQGDFSSLEAKEQAFLQSGGQQAKQTPRLREPLL